MNYYFKVGVNQNHVVIFLSLIITNTFLSMVDVLGKMFDMYLAILSATENAQHFCKISTIQLRFIAQMK